MSEANTVTIGGRRYDAHTGLAIDVTTPTAPVVVQPKQPKAVHHATSMHGNLERSHTLNRRITKKPQASAKPAVSHVAQRADVTAPKSAAITRFAPHPVAKNMDIMRAPQARDVAARPVAAPVAAPVTKAPIVRKTAPAAATSVAQAPAAPVMKPSQMIKHEAIAKAMDAAPTVKELEKKHKKARKSFFGRHPRIFSIASASLGLVLLGGYLTYLNMPSLSVRVASAQAGINASYPQYHPDGYSLDGPVAFSDGQVTMKFTANAGSQNFSVKQSKSSWDSVALLDNYVKAKVGNSYTTYTDRGLTIYTFDSNAAWVNGGILYTIDGNAPLSSDQILRIASSL